LETLKKQTQAVEQRRSDREEKARIVCRTRPSRAGRDPVEKLQEELQGKERLLATEQRGKRQLEEVQRELKSAIERVKNAENASDHLGALITELQKAGVDRQNKWTLWRKSQCKKTRVLFNLFLEKKGHSGSISFEHETEELKVTVWLNGQDANESQRDVRSLSGGEKSFATLALLLATWEVMETPFRAMDEFDVFMDAMRRTLSIQLLIDTASRYRNRQFIFITPQDPTAIKKAPELKIHRLQPPDRSGGEQDVIRPVTVQRRPAANTQQ